MIFFTTIEKLLLQAFLLFLVVSSINSIFEYSKDVQFGIIFGDISTKRTLFVKVINVFLFFITNEQDSQVFTLCFFQQTSCINISSNKSPSKNFVLCNKSSFQISLKNLSLMMRCCFVIISTYYCFHREQTILAEFPSKFILNILVLYPNISNFRNNVPRYHLYKSF